MAEDRLGDVRLEARAVGLAFASANALLFGLYVTLGHRVARDRRFTGIDGLAISMLVAVVFVTPVAAPAAVGAFGDPVALLAGVGVGICSSVVPYVLDQFAMARLERATYSLMVSLLPATAVGLVVLGQVPTVVELVGVSLVVAGVGIHREARPDRQPRPQGEAGAAAPRHRPGHEAYAAEVSAAGAGSAGAGSAAATSAGAGVAGSAGAGAG